MDINAMIEKQSWYIWEELNWHVRTIWKEDKIEK